MSAFESLRCRMHALLYIQARRECWSEWTEGFPDTNLIAVAATDTIVEYELYRKFPLPLGRKIVARDNELALSYQLARQRVGYFRYDPVLQIVIPLQPHEREVAAELLANSVSTNPFRRFRVELSPDIREALAESPLEVET